MEGMLSRIITFNYCFNCKKVTEHEGGVCSKCGQVNDRLKKL